MNKLTKVVGAIVLYLGGCYAAGYIIGHDKGVKRGFEDGTEKIIEEVNKSMHELSKSTGELATLNSDLETLRNKVEEVKSFNHDVTKKLKERIK